MDKRQQEIFLSCIVSRFLGGVQNACASCLVLSSSCFAIIELIFWCICSYSCGDLSHCRSCCCSCCGDMTVCYVIQTGESSSGTYCIRWNVNGKCEKLEVGTTLNWDKKLLIVEAGTSFGIGTENRLKAELSFVSDFRGFVKSLLDRSIEFPSHFAFLLNLFGKCLRCCVVNRMLFPRYDQ